MKKTTCLLVLLIFALTACAGGSPRAADEAATAQAVAANMEATSQALAHLRGTADAQATLDANANAMAEAAAQAQATLEAAATSMAQSTADAVATVTQKAENNRATATQSFLVKRTATAQAVQQATAQAEPMQALIQQVYADGELSSQEGFFLQAEDFDESWANINHFNFWPMVVGLALKDRYIVHANMWWDSASDKANWDRSGCAFIFGINEKSYELIYLAMDGYLKLFRGNDYGVKPVVVKKVPDKLSVPQGEAEFLMAVDGKHIAVYINGKKVLSQNEGALLPGGIVYSLVSGSNKGFGTSCKMTDVWIWSLK